MSRANDRHRHGPCVKTALATAVALLAATACAACSSTPSAEPSCDSACVSNAFALDPTSAAAVVPPGALTGIGATLGAWESAHRADPDPELAPNCCFGPKVRTASGEMTNTWAGVQVDKVVYLYIRQFAAGTTKQAALRAIAAEDLPDDAVQVASDLSQSECELYVYKSAKLGAVPGDLGPYVSFDLNSTDPAGFDPRNVAGADLSISSEADPGSC